MTKSLIVYSTVVGGFYAKTEQLEQAIGKARTEVGDEVWKHGFSGKDAAGATEVAKNHLKQEGIDPVKVEGVITNVGFVENKDGNGNLYPKLQVSVQNDDNEMLLSLDLKSDVAQRLLVKLDNCKPGDHVSISAWPAPVDKGGRTFINHALSMKNEQGTEVPVNTDAANNIRSKTDAIEASLKTAGIDDNKVISTAKNNKRIEAHKELLKNIETRFKNSKPN